MPKINRYYRKRNKFIFFSIFISPLTKTKHKQKQTNCQHFFTKIFIQAPNTVTSHKSRIPKANKKVSTILHKTHNQQVSNLKCQTNITFANKTKNQKIKKNHCQNIEYTNQTKTKVTKNKQNKQKNNLLPTQDSILQIL